MSNDDKRIAEALKQDAPEPVEPPHFDEVFGRAEAEYHWQTWRRYLSVGAAVASVAAVAVALLILAPEEAPLPETLQITGLLDSTSWVAPSDVLLPEHEFDIFEELPEPMGSTESAEGALL
ncbi:MAG: hypothetical protein QNI99_09370 [Woeseiaceae bacterium]|nr:hypothetical protein [Woeseiaceae bacterium]